MNLISSFIRQCLYFLDKMDQCPICLEHFDIGESVRKLICDHIFHDQCIKPWLRMVNMFNFLLLYNLKLNKYTASVIIIIYFKFHQT